MIESVKRVSLILEMRPIANEFELLYSLAAQPACFCEIWSPKESLILFLLLASACNRSILWCPHLLTFSPRFITGRCLAAPLRQRTCELRHSVFDTGRANCIAIHSVVERHNLDFLSDLVHPPTRPLKFGTSSILRPARERTRSSETWILSVFELTIIYNGKPICYFIHTPSFCGL